MATSEEKEYLRRFGITNWPALDHEVWIKNLDAFALKLNEKSAATNSVSAYIREKLSTTTRRLLASYQGGFDVDLQNALMIDLSKIFDNNDFYQKQRFSNVILSPESKQLLMGHEGRVCVLNIHLLLDTYTNELAPLDSALLNEDYKMAAESLLERVRNTTNPATLEAWAAQIMRVLNYKTTGSNWITLKNVPPLVTHIDPLYGAPTRVCFVPGDNSAPPYINIFWLSGWGGGWGIRINERSFEPSDTNLYFLKWTPSVQVYHATH